MAYMLAALLGGTLLGIAASLLLYGIGRVFGISAILASLFTQRPNDRGWRLGVVCGLVAAGFLLKLRYPAALPFNVPGSLEKFIISGFLVGFGSQLGSGCTSGHGICGISRFSIRSITATVVFIVTGMITVYCVRVYGGTP